MDKPITIIRAECIDRICEALNQSGLPAFVKVELMERIMAQLQPMVDEEYQRDLARWSAETEGE